MAKYYGKIGYAETYETRQGIYEEVIVEKDCFGDIIRNTHRFNSNDTVNHNIVLSNQISIVSNPYIENNIQNIRYITYMGSKWCVTDANIEYPRIILSLGEVYNE